MNYILEDAMKVKQLSSLEIFNSIRKPAVPVGGAMKNKQEKRVKKFDYRKELDIY